MFMIIHICIFYYYNAINLLNQGNFMMFHVIRINIFIHIIMRIFMLTYSIYTYIIVIIQNKFEGNVTYDEIYIHG